jgi:hypothetical protein
MQDHDAHISALYRHSADAIFKHVTTPFGPECHKYKCHFNHEVRERILARDINKAMQDVTNRCTNSAVHARCPHPGQRIHAVVGG